MADAGPARARPTFRLLRSELRLVFGRRRNNALLAALACVPVLIAVAIRLAAGTAARATARRAGLHRPIAGNGLFVAFTALVVTLPLFLPLAVSVAAGEAIAGEASIGTLRNLFVVPVSRTRLLVVKFAGVVAFGVAAAFTVGDRRAAHRARPVPDRAGDAAVGRHAGGGRGPRPGTSSSRSTSPRCSRGWRRSGCSPRR